MYKDSKKRYFTIKKKLYTVLAPLVDAPVVKHINLAHLSAHFYANKVFLDFDWLARSGRGHEGNCLCCQ